MKIFEIEKFGKGIERSGQDLSGCVVSVDSGLDNLHGVYGEKDFSIRETMYILPHILRPARLSILAIDDRYMDKIAKK